MLSGGSSGPWVEDERSESAKCDDLRLGSRLSCESVNSLGSYDPGAGSSAITERLPRGR